MVPAMLSPSDASSIGDEIAEFIRTHGIHFERGNPRQYFEQIAHVSASLTLPIVPAERLRTLVLLKSFYSLWNIVVDDEMDRAEGTRHHLDSSIQLLLRRSRGEPGPLPGATAGAATLDAILSQVPQDAASAPLRELLYFDFWELMTGFCFEYAINKERWAANSEEYGKYSTVTAGIKHFFDLDCLFADRTLEPTTYRRLRLGYEQLGLAIKFASDMGSLKRELLDEDNLNIIRIRAMESGVPGVERKLENEAQYQAVLPTLQPLFEKTRQKAFDNLNTCRELLTGVQGLDTAPFLKAVTAIVETYSKRDPFFRQK